MAEIDLSQLYVALLLIVITAVIFFLYNRRRTVKRNILLTGLCDSGKTLLFSQLVHGKYLQTYTSMKENIAEYVVKNGRLKIVDIPGHERLRSRYLELYENSARGIVFVVDSTTINTDVRDAAEYVYLMLCNALEKNIKNMLILCNKQDQKNAADVGKIEELLEKEISTVRFTKSKQLDSVYSKEKKSESLGDSEEPFNFSVLKIKVDFAPCAAYAEDDSANIDSLKQWLNEIN